MHREVDRTPLPVATSKGLVSFLTTIPAGAEPGEEVREGVRVGLAFAVAAMLAVSAFAAGSIQSGLKAGESMSPFDVVDITGPDKRQLCLV